MALSRAHRREETKFWPGFVDALSTMLIGIVFLLTVFVLGQFFLSQELTGKDTALERRFNVALPLEGLGEGLTVEVLARRLLAGATTLREAAE